MSPYSYPTVKVLNVSLYSFYDTFVNFTHKNKNHCVVDNNVHTWLIIYPLLLLLSIFRFMAQSSYTIPQASFFHYLQNSWYQFFLGLRSCIQSHVDVLIVTLSLYYIGIIPALKNHFHEEITKAKFCLDQDSRCYC